MARLEYGDELMRDGGVMSDEEFQLRPQVLQVIARPPRPRVGGWVHWLRKWSKRRLRLPHPVEQAVRLRRRDREAQVILVRKKSSARISVEEWAARALVVTVGVLLLFLIAGGG